MLEGGVGGGGGWGGGGQHLEASGVFSKTFLYLPL